MKTMGSNRVVVGLCAGGLAFGCRPPPPEVPEDLGATAEEMFRLFDEQPENLPFFMAAAEEQMAVFDLTAPIADRKFELQVLDPTGLDITFPAEEPPENQSPILVVGQSRHPFASSILPAFEDNQVCIESDTTVAYRRTWLEGSAECLEDGSCDVARTTNEVRKQLSFIARGWYDLKKDIRVFEMEDGRPAMLVRGWTERVYCGDQGNNRFAQTYTLEGWIGDGDTTKRFYAGWLEIDIGLGSTAMKNLIADSFDQGFEFGDNWVDMEWDEYCPNDPSAEIEGSPGDTCR